MDHVLILGIHLIVNGIGDVDVNAADGVHEVGQTGKLDFSVVGNLHAGKLFDRLDGAGRALLGEGLVNLHLLAVKHIRRVARHGNHGDLMVRLVDSHEHERIGTLPVGFPVVRTDEQHVIRLHLIVFDGREHLVELLLLLRIHRNVAREAVHIPGGIAGRSRRDDHDCNEHAKQHALERGMALALLANANQIVVGVAAGSGDEPLPLSVRTLAIPSAEFVV